MRTWMDTDLPEIMTWETSLAHDLSASCRTAGADVHRGGAPLLTFGDVWSLGLDGPCHRPAVSSSTVRALLCRWNDPLLLVRRQAPLEARG